VKRNFCGLHYIKRQAGSTAWFYCLVLLLHQTADAGDILWLLAKEFWKAVFRVFVEGEKPIQ